MIKFLIDFFTKLSNILAYIADNYTMHKFNGKRKLIDIDIHHTPKDLEPTESRLFND